MSSPFSTTEESEEAACAAESATACDQRVGRHAEDRKGVGSAAGGVLARREQTAAKLHAQLEAEMKRIDVMMGEMQRSMSERTTQLQSLRNQLETLKRSLDGEASSAKVMERCSSEMKKMQEKVNAEYARKLNLIQRKNGMKKRNEIQVGDEKGVECRN